MLKNVNPGVLGLLALLGLVAASACWIACGSGGGGGSSALPAPPPAPPPPPPPPEIGDWTDLTPSADTVTIHVSTSDGNDSNDGLTPGTPKATIAAGKALLRDGFPDWLVLKAGDTWTNQDFDSWSLSGRSASEPMVITSYGSGARPYIRTGTDNGLNMFVPVSHVFFVGLHFQAHTFTGTQGTIGMFILGGIDDVLVEDCRIEGYSDNIVIQTGADFRLRRSVIVDSYSTASHSQGIYAEAVAGLLIEQCLFDHNGWKAGVPGAEETIFNHNIYVQSDCTNVTILGNISAQASSHGLQLRPGGTSQENLFLRNGLAMFAAGEGAGPALTRVENNVVLDGKDIGGAPRGSGIAVFDSRNALVKNNVVAHKPPGVGLEAAFAISGFQDDSSSVNYAIVFEDNISYRWNGTALQLADTYTSLTVRRNIFQDLADGELMIEVPALHGFEVFQDNQYSTSRALSQWYLVGASSMSFSEWETASGETGGEAIQVAFPDPDRTIATYQTLQAGTPTLEAFLAEARLQSKENWRTQYTAPAVNDYIRAGFGR